MFHRQADKGGFAPLGLSPGEADRSRIHVCVGAFCNNNCLFCMEDDREGRRKRILSAGTAGIETQIRQNRAMAEIMFTSGEPCLNPRLPRYVMLARKMGYKTIGITTNGRMLCYEDFCERLLEAGLNLLVVSIHGSNAKEHDSLTRAPGSFEQTMAGLGNLSGLKTRYGLRISTSTVIVRRNLGMMARICRMLSVFSVDQFVFNVIKPQGRGEKLFHNLVPRYRDVAASFKDFLSGLSRRMPEVVLVDIPLCVTEGIPDRMRGYVERYFHYEPGPDGKHIRVDRVHSEAPLKTKLSSCRDCRYESACEGLWKIYLSNYGEEEFHPVLKDCG